MSYGIKGATRTHRCPICGHDDWCGFLATQDGELIICKRMSSLKGEAVMGTDGGFYMCVGRSQSDNSCFMEANEYMAAQAKFGANYTPKVPEPPTVIDPVEQLPDFMLDRYYRAILSHLTLEDIHRKYLHEEGWTDEMIDYYQVVSLPERDYTRMKYRKDERRKSLWRKKIATLALQDLNNPAIGMKGVPGAYQPTDDSWSFTGPSGIVFRQKNFKDQITGFRIRMDYLDVNGAVYTDPLTGKQCFDEAGEKWFLQPMKGAYQLLPDGTKSFRKDGKFKGKYRNFASFAENEEEAKNNRIVNIYKNGCSAGNRLSYYADPDRDDMFICYVTEGEKKGAFANWHMKAPFISLPGVDSWTLLLRGSKGERPVDILKSQGCLFIVVAFDADKSTNATVLDRERKTVEALREEGFTLGVASWDISLGKGIDDLIAKGHRPEYEIY